MDSYKSDVVKIAHPISKVYAKLSTPSSFKNIANIDRLPDDASEAIRLVRIGDYDVCPCIGKHVRSTAQIGKFVLLGTNWDEHAHSLRIRFKIVQ